MNVAAHQEKKKNENMGKREAGKKRENNRPMSNRLRAALLLLFRGSMAKKWFEKKMSARGNWDLRKGQQPFRPNRKGVGDRTTLLRRLLIGAVQTLL